jgi:hypothetical protein
VRIGRVNGAGSEQACWGRMTTAAKNKHHVLAMVCNSGRAAASTRAGPKTKTSHAGRPT